MNETNREFTVHSATHTTESAAHLSAQELHQLSTTKLMGEIAGKAAQLVGKEMELARSEIKQDVQAEISAVKRLAVAAVAGIATLNLLLLAVVFALAPYMGDWAAALSLAAITLLITLGAGVFAWRNYISDPLSLTRKSLREDVQWAKEEMA